MVRTLRLARCGHFRFSLPALGAIPDPGQADDFFRDGCLWRQRVPSLLILTRWPQLLQTPVIGAGFASMRGTSAEDRGSKLTRSEAPAFVTQPDGTWPAGWSALINDPEMGALPGPPRVGLGRDPLVSLA
jgi:hypothetical protein